MLVQYPQTEHHPRPMRTPQRLRRRNPRNIGRVRPLYRWEGTDMHTGLEINNIIPAVVESTNRGERSWDIYSRLLRDRIVFVGTPIDSQVANVFIAQLL